MFDTIQQLRPRIPRVKGALTALAILGAFSIAAIELGPRVQDTPPGEPAKDATLDAMALRLAIPVLNPGIPSSQQEQFKSGIWPELRNAEAMRIAVKLREQIDRRGTFRDVVVSPDTSASADFYLLARIDESNGEDLKLRWSLVDATQTYRIPANCRRSSCWKRDDRRVWDGWHEANDVTKADPFEPLYAKIADQVHSTMKDLARKHESQIEKNRRAKSGRASKLSELQAAKAARSVVFAAYFAPDIYGDAITQQRGRLKLSYLPSQDGEEWTRIEAIRVRDERFAVLVSEQYGGFADRMHNPYSEWQKESFPLARQARLARREATLSAIGGGIAALGAAAAAEDGKDTTAGALAAAGAAAIVNSIAERKKASAMQTEINELGATAQIALKPMVVATRDRTVTLTGTAREQFTQWRTLLRDLYTNTSTDFEAVQFAEDGEG